MSALATHCRKVFELKNFAQQYDWGKIGSSSLVGRLFDAQKSIEVVHSGGSAPAVGSAIKESEAYAELWIGTHPSGPSTLLGNSTTTLQQLIDQDPATHLGGRYDPKSPTPPSLPFLLKVLSIKKVLSIQAHPDKALAAQLHASNPAMYKDCNHKPEMAIALTPFQAMAGFRPVHEILRHLDLYPEFAAALDHKAVESLRSECRRVVVAADFDAGVKSSLRAVFTSYMSVGDTPEFKASLASLVSRLEDAGSRALAAETLGPLDSLLLDFHRQFPGDSGVLSPLLLNVVDLVPGQSLFVPSNSPHAYISGDIVECMAASDNVVRCGLTPKFKDVPVLCDMLSYNAGHAVLDEDRKILPDGSTRYRPPVDDFEVVIVDLKNEGDTCAAEPVDCGSVFLCLGGSGELSCECADDGGAAGGGVLQTVKLLFGASVFVSANGRVTIEAGEGGVKVARAQGNMGGV